MRSARITVLGLDTATSYTTVGVSRDGDILTERSERGAAGHASGLPGLVAQALAEMRIGVGGLDAIAVSQGPGSFTGLRVGISFAKGLGLAAGKPVLGVDTLAALAEAAPMESDGRVITCLDARRGEVYLAVYRRARGAVLEELSPKASTPQAAAEEIARLGGTGPRIVVGDGAPRYPEAFARLEKEGVRILPFESAHPRGGIVALLGARRAGTGEGRMPPEIGPVYVRASSAERGIGRVTLTSEKTL